MNPGGLTHTRVAPTPKTKGAAPTGLDEKEGSVGGGEEGGRVRERRRLKKPQSWVGMGGRIEKVVRGEVREREYILY